MQFICVIIYINKLIMRKKYLMIGSMLAAAATASAQILNSGIISESPETKKTKKTKTEKYKISKRPVFVSEFQMHSKKAKKRYNEIVSNRLKKWLLVHEFEIMQLNEPETVFAATKKKAFKKFAKKHPNLNMYLFDVIRNED